MHTIKDKLEKFLKEKNKLNLCFGMIIIIIVIILIAIFNPLKSNHGKSEFHKTLHKGWITINGTKSREANNLFYKVSNDRYMINLSGLDELTNFDVLKIDDEIIISNIKNQMSIKLNDKSYKFNTVEFKDDDSYLSPNQVQGMIFADCNKIFNEFGYEILYEYFKDSTGKDSMDIIELKLNKSEEFDNYEYTEIEVKETKLNNEKPNPPSGKIPGNEEDRNTDKSSLPLIPDDAVVDKDSLTEPQLLPEISEIPKINGDTDLNEDKNDEQTDNQEEIEDSTIKNPTEQERKDEMWKEIEPELKDLFQNSTPNYNHPAYVEFGENTFGFNGGVLGSYGNSVVVYHDHPQGYFLVVELSAEWSDQALNVVSNESKTFYSGLEEVYHKTIIQVLGENKGEEFFQYLKKHADKTQAGGYISQYNEKGIIESVWTDGPVGDGIMASELDLEDYAMGFTDDGFLFEISRNEDGIRIIIY